MPSTNKEKIYVAFLAIILFPFFLIYWIGSWIVFITWDINTKWELPDNK